MLRDVDEHWRVWRDVHIGQLSAEIVAQLHRYSRTDRAKHQALQRLYASLRAFMLLVGVSAPLFAYLSWM